MLHHKIDCFIVVFPTKQHGPVPDKAEDFITDRKTRLSAIMTPLSQLVTEKEGIDLKQANETLQKSKKDCDANVCLVGRCHAVCWDSLPSICSQQRCMLSRGNQYCRWKIFARAMTPQALQIVNILFFPNRRHMISFYFLVLILGCTKATQSTLLHCTCRVNFRLSPTPTCSLHLWLVLTSRILALRSTETDFIQIHKKSLHGIRSPGYSLATVL